jgi:hypothetical protein
MTDPYTGPPPAMCTAVAPAIGQPTLTYNTYVGKYMMVGSALPGNSVCGAVYSLSADLIHWTATQLMRTVPQCQPNGGSTLNVYFSIIDHNDASVNFENSGQTPFLYYTRFNDGLSSLNRDLVRVPMVITSN